jgi:hypothetical protein
MYCPSGWVPADNPERNEGEGERGFAVLTNRVCFEVP